jgi:glycosyltransferase involved in cell wall biosynthesis
MNSYSVSIVVPVYKNEGSIEHLLNRISEISGAVTGSVEAVFVVDGSPDKSLEVLRSSLPRDGFDAKVLLLSRNFGAFSAIRAGLREARGEATVVMAADLQEPTSLILDMLGIVQRDEADVAVGVRQSRKDGVVSRTLSAVFWKVFNRVSSLELPRGGVDIFALSRSARETLNSFEESSTSLIGLIYWMGFRRQEVPYHRVERQVGKSSWSLQKRINYAKDSITAFSEFPLSVFLWSGVIGALVSLVFALIGAYQYVFTSDHQSRREITAIGLLFVASYLMAGLGVLGTYLWRIADNVRKRPDSITWKTWEMPSRKNGE